MVVNWDCSHPRLRWCGNARLTRDRLVSLWMYVNFDWTFADAVRRLGAPSYVGYFVDDSSGMCRISLYWAAMGVSVSGEELFRHCPTQAAAERRLGPISS